VRITIMARAIEPIYRPDIRAQSNLKKPKVIFACNTGGVHIQAFAKIATPRMKAAPCVQCVTNGLFTRSTHRTQGRRKPEPGLLHNSGRGSQYASHECRGHLSIIEMQQAISRKGNCSGNSPAERFFRGLRYEQLNYEKLRAKASAKLSVIDYLAFYNGKRTIPKVRLSNPAAIWAGFL
jgi:hypothetical protein